MQELSVKEIKRYNYSKAKEYVDELLFDLKHISTKLVCLLPPGYTHQLSFVDKVQESHTNNSKIELYIENKDYYERQIKKELEKLKNNIEVLTENEKTIFEETYIFQNTDIDVQEKLGWSYNKINRLRKSFIIKLALSKGMDFEK